jgi:hypothetical protein
MTKWKEAWRLAKEDMPKTIRDEPEAAGDDLVKTNENRQKRGEAPRKIEN